MSNRSVKSFINRIRPGGVRFNWALDRLPGSTSCSLVIFAAEIVQESTADLMSSVDPVRIPLQENSGKARDNSMQ